MLNYFDTAHWLHFDDFATSTYMLIPVNKEDVETYLKNLLKMFSDIYPELEAISL
jgi:hypothetical protein